MVINLIYCLLKTLSYFVIATILVFVVIKIYLLLTKPTCTCKVKLDGKVVLITGGNAGIGLETAKILARRGARVVIASRNVAKSQAAVRHIIGATGNCKVECKSLDLGSLASVKQFADDFNANYDRLDILINNAGFSAFKRVKTENGIDSMMQVNHVAHVYLTSMLLDKIIRSKPSRIIFVASGAHKYHHLDPEDLVGNKTPWLYTHYVNTKVCNVLAAKALAKRVPSGVTVNSLHPGLASTEIFDCLPWPMLIVFRFLVHCFLKSVEDCAQTSVHVACAPSLAHVSGQYFDDCAVAPTCPSVTDELAERVWENTMALIEDRTQKL